MSTTKKITLHELALKTPGESSTRHILEDSERTPEKIMEFLKGYMPFKIEKQLVSEKYTITGCEWASNPDQVTAIKEQKTLTRDLKLYIKFQKNGIINNLEIILPEIPVPSINGSYIYGENTKNTPGEYFFSNKLIQKPGIFPINLEENNSNKDDLGILFESLESTIIQTKSELLIAIKNTNVNKYKKQSETIRIPKELWGNFDNLIRESRTNPYIKWENHTEIEKQIKKGFGFDTKENARVRLNEWIKQISNQQIKKGSWQTRFEKYPSLSVNTPWDLTKADQIDKILHNPENIKFLDTNDIGRKYLETSSDVTAQIISQEILKCLTQNQYTNKDLKTHAFVQNWDNIPWSDLLASRCILDTKNKSQNFGGPVKTAALANRIEVINNTINTEETRSDTERKIHNSFKGAIAYTTLENSEVGRMHYLCSGAKVDPITKEILRPIVVVKQTKKGPETILKDMTPEEIEKLENELKNQKRIELKNLNPDKSSEIPDLNPGEMYAYLDMSTDDYLPLELLFCPNIEYNAPARYGVLKAFGSAALATYGSTVDPAENEKSKAASRKIINNGEIIYSPETGTVVNIDSKNKIITLKTSNDSNIEIPYYSNITNSFGDERGLECIVQVGEKIIKNQPILQSNNDYITPTQDMALSVPCITVSGSSVEDDYKISSAAAISGRFTFSKQNTISTEGLTSGSIKLSNKIQPGSLIREGDILGTRTVIVNSESGKPNISKEVPWIASSKETGILKSVKFIDKDIENSNNFKLNVDPSALEPVNISNVTMNFLNNVIQEFDNEIKNWDIDFQNECENFDIDLKYLYETIKYEILIDDKWIEKKFHLSELTSNPEKRKELLNDLSFPNEKFKADLSYSILNERICRNTRIDIHKIIKLSENEIKSNDIPKVVNRVDLIIEQKVNLKTGSKLACPNGTKGTVVIVPNSEMPIIKVSDKYKFADTINNKLAILARGSVGAFHVTGIDPDEQKQESLNYQKGAGMIGTDTHVAMVGYIVQSTGVPQKSNFIGYTIGGKGINKGVKVSQIQDAQAEMANLMSDTSGKDRPSR